MTALASGRTVVGSTRGLLSRARGSFADEFFNSSPSQLARRDPRGGCQVFSAVPETFPRVWPYRVAL